MTTAQVSDAAERQYRQVRDVERDTGEWDVHHPQQPEGRHSQPTCADPRAEDEPTAENG
jgi:hypothetical protein